MADTIRPWQDALFILKTLGIYSSKKLKKNVVLSLFYIILSIFTIFMVLIHFPILNGDVFQLVTNLEAFFAFSQLMGKVAVCFKNQEELTKLFEKTEQFWKTEVCPCHIKAKLDNMSITAKLVERVFVGCAIATILAIIVYSLIENILPLGIWAFENYKVLFKFTQISQIIVIMFNGVGIVTFDCIFFITCVQTIIQFKILRYCLSDLSLFNVHSERDQKQYYDKLKLYIQQHNFLLGFLRDLQNYYSLAFVMECLTIAPLVCTEIYALLDSNAPDQQIRHAIICFTQIFQLTFYCITADSLSNEALAVGDAVYNSDWYSNYSPPLGRRMIMLIQKSQQPVIFTAGGLFEIKSTTVLTVLRISWSACTVMRNLKIKK